MLPGYRDLKKYTTCIKVAITIRIQLVKMHKIAWKGTIISPSTKPLLKRITPQKLTNDINPYKMGTKYIQHIYNLHIGVGSKL